MVHPRAARDSGGVHEKKIYIQGILCDQKWVSLNRRNLGVNKCKKKAKKGVIFLARARARARESRAT